MKKNSNLKSILFYIIVIVTMISLSTYLLGGMNKQKELVYSDIVDLFHEGEVQEFVVTNDNVLAITKTDGTELSYTLRSVDMFWEDLGELIDEQYSSEDGNLQKYHFEAQTEIPWWVSFLPYLIIIAAVIIMYVVMMNQAMGKGGKINSFGKARAKLGSDEKKKVLFKDVAGADEEKEELREVVDFLKDPKRFTDLGARIPKGVLLVGPPGTGKTLLAKAVAGEAGVPFFSISGSDFVEMYVGVGASRVRDLFDTAKKSSPAIIFIDEIDAVGRHRGAGLGGGHDEREQTLNQLLVEMDGFGNNDGVIVIAATNRPDILDPALLRPGRFDRQVTVNYPDVKGREEILKVHGKGKHFEEHVDFKVIARSTAGFTGADLENLLNEAALLTARKNKKYIGMDEIEEATIKVIVGPAKKSKVISDYDKKITAIHEAGHAVVSYFLKHHDPVHQISIIPAGAAAGYTLYVPKEDKMHMSKHEMEDNLVSLLGGRVAESVMLDDICTGASNDIQRATDIARKMVTTYGMSDKLGPIVYGSGHEEVFLGRDFNSTPNYSEKVASVIDEEIRRIIDEAYTKATESIKANKDKVDRIADFLIKYETMTEEQFMAVMAGEPTDEELVEIAEEKRRKSREATENSSKQTFKVKKNGTPLSDEIDDIPESDAQPDNDSNNVSESDNDQ
ncbi:MAG: ATP-dependent metallopeptidase FtsH/Yme1/Tma family protein [Ruminococcaceae bacterium]|nr:ATP-dependent metallopeptidase FtsH/Yme1/Tma family protein [Oscillospiraceae bacterium]